MTHIGRGSTQDRDPAWSRPVRYMSAYSGNRSSTPWWVAYLAWLPEDAQEKIREVEAEYDL